MAGFFALINGSDSNAEAHDLLYDVYPKQICRDQLLKQRSVTCTHLEGY